MNTNQNIQKVKELVEKVRDRMEEAPNEAIEYLAECDRIIESMPDDTAKGMLIAMVYQYYIQLEQMGYSDNGYIKVLEISEKVEGLRDIAVLNSNLGLIYSRKGNLNRSLEHFTNALEYFEKNEEKPMLAQLYNNIGVIHSNKLEFDRALDFMMKALKIREELGDKGDLCDINVNIGNLYNRIANPEMAVEYFQQALRFCDEANNNTICGIYSNLCQSYMMLARTEDALSNGLKALELYDEMEDSHPKADLLNNMGNLYFNLHDYARARNFYQKAIDMNRVNDEKWGIANALTSMANSEIFLRQFDNALTHLMESRVIAEEIAALDILFANHQNTFFLYMNFADHEKENYLKRSGYLQKALEEQSALLELRERISTVEKTRALAEMDKKYESEKKAKEAEIYRLKNVELAAAYEQLKSAQNEIIKLERTTSVSAMAVTANHEINQPLTVLQGNLDLLEIQLSGDQDTMKYLEKARQAAQKIRDIVARYKDIENYRFADYSKKTKMVVLEDKKPEDMPSE